MKKTVAFALLLAAVAAFSGCAYGGVAALGPDKVVIAKNNGFLFGVLNKVYVCKAGDQGLTECNKNEAP